MTTFGFLRTSSGIVLTKAVELAPSVSRIVKSATSRPFPWISEPLIPSWTPRSGPAAKHRAKGNGFGFGLNGTDGVARTLSARYYKDGSEILIKRPSGSPRRLTPRECARLMGFDKPGESKFKIKVSDTQAYRQFGNAVVAPVATDVARLMLPFISEVAGVTQDARAAMAAE